MFYNGRWIVLLVLIRFVHQVATKLKEEKPEEGREGPTETTRQK